jgi:hypothetical protein
MLRIAKVTVTLEIVYPADVCDEHTAVGVIAEDIVRDVEYVAGMSIDRESVTSIDFTDWQAEVQRRTVEHPDVSVAV